jgi:hypothetical protein
MILHSLAAKADNVFNAQTIQPVPWHGHARISHARKKSRLSQNKIKLPGHI